MVRKSTAAKAEPSTAQAGTDKVAVLPVDAPKSTDLIAEVNDVFSGLVVTAIDSPMMYALAAAELVELQEKHKVIEDKRFSITRPMDVAKKAAMDLFRPHLERLDEKIKSLKAGMLDYEKEQKRKAAAEQALLDRVADQQRALLAQERERAAEEARLQSERAAALIEAGDTDGAAAALDAAEQSQEMAAALNKTAMVVSAATADLDVPTVAGISSADVWKARVTDLPALLRYIADHPEHHDWIEVRMTPLNDLAKAQRTAMRIPGVEPYEEQVIAARRRAA